jgi:hypothetical protein
LLALHERFSSLKNNPMPRILLIDYSVVCL